MLKNLFASKGQRLAAGPAEPLKLNLGSGFRRFDGYLSVDKFPDCDPDVVMDLEALPWPFADNSASHILLCHVLEHIGQSSDLFLRLMQELYRVCAPGAEVRIMVPHPRHDTFLGDPTHVRPVMPATIMAFDQAMNRDWQAANDASTPLGLYLGVDFQIARLEYILDPMWRQRVERGEISLEKVFELAREQNNVISEFDMTLIAHKPGRG